MMIIDMTDRTVDEYQCATCSKFGNCTVAILMALSGEVMFCGWWEKNFRTYFDRGEDR